MPAQRVFILTSVLVCPSLHPSMPILATASGQRHVDTPMMDVDSDAEEDDDAEEEGDNSLRLWWIGK